MSNDEINTESSEIIVANEVPAFIWPEPGEDWWNAKGAMFRLDDETIRFSACLHALGGSRARKNSQAAKNAGLDWNRVDAFRVARSAGVARLLDEAAKIKKGNLPPLTEEDIDREIDDLIRTKDPLTKSRGIELREKRIARRQATAPEDGPIDPIKRCSELDDALLAAFCLAHHNILKAPDWLKQKLPAAALAATRIRGFNTQWSRALVEEIAQKFGVKLEEATQPQAGNGHIESIGPCPQ